MHIKISKTSHSKHLGFKNINCLINCSNNKFNDGGKGTSLKILPLRFRTFVSIMYQYLQRTTAQMSLSRTQPNFYGGEKKILGYKPYTEYVNYVA